MDELISVIISTYKRDEELDRAIRSVLSQTYKNIEVIVVDDNGKDSIWQKKVESIINKYSHNNKEFKYIVNEKNIGASLTRNIGIKNSKGKYISFLDDDDEYYPEKLEKQIELFKKSNNPQMALIYAYTDSYDENKKKLKEYRYDYKGNCLVDSMCDCIASTSQWLCRKEALEAVDNFTDVPCKQDSTVIIKLLSKGYEIDRVPQVLIKYNEHSKLRISSRGMKNILGEEILREFCRSLYKKLESVDILKIETNFSYRLSKLYVKNNVNEKLEKEMRYLKKIDKIKWLSLKMYYYLKKYNRI